MRFTISLAYRLYNPTNDFKDIKIIHIGDKNQNHFKKCCSLEILSDFVYMLFFFQDQVKTHIFSILFNWNKIYGITTSCLKKGSNWHCISIIMIIRLKAILLKPHEQKTFGIQLYNVKIYNIIIKNNHYSIISSFDHPIWLIYAINFETCTSSSCLILLLMIQRDSHLERG